ncbi:hypothetical protein [Costertonia aggregata]|uniref:Sperm nuclear basic protein PL-I n=1 Tax=Costertonia aggregata TaxID=343403 RepID=A0A7H9AV83_9FLAO|nr:hypothetical protein [Costertonia aggregata]QLG47122.1 hypothetical protein HYG79_17745 [Costertonia aggregata]
MKKLVLLLSAVVLGTTGIMASTLEDKVATRNAYRFNNSFIFVENGITFSVYPDGEFDFYIDNRVNIGANVNFGRTNITFNSGFDYSPFAQYDDYGAVIQVENVPIFYDFYGRVNQIGNININYRNGRVNRLGGMYVFYNNRGIYSRHTGFINVYNRNYIYRPFHRFFARPAVGLCLVYNRPYRRFYQPIRYTFHRPYRFNTRRAYAQVGRNYTYNRTRRSNIYRNDNRVVARENNRARRSNDGLRTRTNNRVYNGDRVATRKNSNARTTRSLDRKGVVNRGNRTVNRSSNYRSNSANRKAVNRNATERTVTKRSTRTVRPNSTGRTVTKREVTRTPRSTSVTRSTKTYKRPQSRNSSRSTFSRSTKTQRSAAVKPASRKSRSSGTVSRSSSTKRTISRAPSSRSSRSTASRSSRSTRRY